MSTQRKRIISLLLAAAMILSFVPPVYAVDSIKDGIPEEHEETLAGFEPNEDIPEEQLCSECAIVGIEPVEVVDSDQIEETSKFDAQNVETQTSNRLYWNISKDPVQHNANNGSLPNAAAVFAYNRYYFNLQVTSDIYLKSAYLYVKPYGSSSYELVDSYTANGYFRWHCYSYWFDTPGEFSYYWVVYYTNSSGTSDGGSQTLTTTTITVNEPYSMDYDVSSYGGYYDGSPHSISFEFSNPSDPQSYKIYYSTTTELRSSNYQTDGSTTKPTRTNAGQTKVYYYIDDLTGEYYNYYGYAHIYIYPKVSSSSYSGTYDGSAHRPSFYVSGGATLYYSTTTQLTYSNYSSSGSTTIPSRTSVGTTTVYYIAVPNSDAGSGAVITGQSSITINAASYTVTASGYTGTYDGSAHSVTIKVSGISSYTIYYSTSVALDASNYNTAGSTSKPSRTSAGKTVVYYYVKESTGNYRSYSGSVSIIIKPKVSATAASGTYNGSSYSPTIVATGGAKLYYSTTTPLTGSNYATGSTTIPSRTAAGTTTVYYAAVPTSNASSECVTTGSTKITVYKASLTHSATAYAGVYDSKSHSATIYVSGPSSYTVYYNTSFALNESNHEESGTTTRPTRTSSGVTNVYYYIKDKTGNYNGASGSTTIRISPKVLTTAYTGAYDGVSHSATVTASGAATLYYSTSTALTYSNYKTSGSLTIPTRTAAGTTTVYYIAVPNANASSETCTTGSTTITINGASTVVTSADYRGTYDGASHKITINVSGPSSYSIYYSTTTALNLSNYTTGTTTAPSRTNAGATTVYYFVKDLTGNYGNKSGSQRIIIVPKVQVKPYAGNYDGKAHSLTVTATGGAKLYYSTSTSLTYSNYLSAGSATPPTRTEAGTTTVYYIAVPTSDADSVSCAAGSSTITIQNAQIDVSATAYSGVYDGNSHRPSFRVSGPSSYTIYYGTSALNDSNYRSGTTVCPTRTKAGFTEVYYYIIDNSNNYAPASGKTTISIAPKVSATAYSGTYDGASHTAAVTAQGGAVIYYSTSTQLTAANYAAAGSRTAPTRTNAGTTTVYYIAVPDSGSVNAGVVTAGSTTITIHGASTIVTASEYTGTYDGFAHSAAIHVSGPSNYTIYYSATTALNSGNYSEAGTKTAVTRTDAGQTTVYYYVRDNTGNYGDRNGTTYIYISPKVTATAYKGVYDGKNHSAAVTAQGNATVYYSTSQALTAQNYSAQGSTTVPVLQNAGKITVYYLAVANTGTISSHVVTGGSTTITIEQAAMTVTADSCYGIYNGQHLRGTVNVQGPTAYSIFYSTTEKLNESNYTNGVTQNPGRMLSGETCVYYYVEDHHGNYASASGSFYIRIKPETVAIPYNGQYSGTPHSATITVSGDAKLYYSKEQPLSYSNYSTAGSTTLPTLTQAGSLTIYYLALPNNQPSADTVTNGSVNVSISTYSIADCIVQLSDTSFTYDGTEKRPAVSVMHGNASLLEDRDFTVRYANHINAGEASLTVSGIGNYSGSVTKSFLIAKADQKVSASLSRETILPGEQAVLNASGIGSLQYQSSDSQIAAVSSTGIVTGIAPGQATITVTASGNQNYNAGKAVLTIAVISPTQEANDISNCSVTLERNTFVYDGSPKKPSVTVKDGSQTLQIGTDYTLTYSDNTNAGTAFVVITGCGKYKNDVRAYFLIEQAEPKLQFESDTVEKTTESTSFLNPLSCNSPGAIRYSSDTVTVAKVDPQTGVVTIVGKGSAVITASASETQNYKTAVKSYTVLVTSASLPQELELNSLSYTFANNAAGFGYPQGYRIPLASYELIFGTNVKARTYYATQGDWGGNCNGMASTSALLFDTENGINVQSFSDDTDTIGELKLEDYFDQLDLSLLTFIEAMQISQKTERYNSVRGANKVYTLQLRQGKATLNALYREITSELRLSNPTLIAVCQSNSGHALLAYETEEISDTESRVYVYDCNYPFEKCYITFTKDTRGDYTGWSYDIGGIYGVWGQADDASISYIPYGTILEIWNKRGNLEETTNVAEFNSKNIALYNAEEELIASMIEGQLVTSDPIITVVEYDLTLSPATSDHVMLRIPADIYTVKNLDADLELFEMRIVDTNLGATVSTTADTIIMAVDDNSHTNAVFIQAGYDDTYSITLNSSFEQDSNEVCVEGSGANALLEVSQSGGNITISNCNIGSMTVDGSTVHFYTMTAACTVGGSITPSGSSTVAEGAELTYIIQPDNGYAVKAVYVDGVDVGATNLYTFQNISCNHSIYAVFEPADHADICPGKNFTDMPDVNSWAHEPIDWAITQGITTGISSTKFGPEDNCNRAQVVTFLWRAAGKPEPNVQSSPFADVPESSYYYKAVLWAVEKGITSGTSATTFGPEATCIRAQIVTFLWRFEGKPDPASKTNPFVDVPQGSFYEMAVLWAADNGITNGISATQFSPESTCNRAQVVTFLYRDLT